MTKQVVDARNVARTPYRPLLTSQAWDGRSVKVNEGRAYLRAFPSNHSASNKPPHPMLLLRIVVTETVVLVA